MDLEILTKLLNRIDKLEKRVRALEASQKIGDPTLFEVKPKERFKPPLEIEVSEYFKTNGYSQESAKRAFKYYSEAKWKDGKGDKIRNWKQKMIGVWFKEGNEAVKLSEKGGTNQVKDTLPDNYGIPSPTATPMPDSLRKRFKNIGNESK